MNRILEQMQRFSTTYGKGLTVGRAHWRYYRVGAGPAIFWLTGGLRRAALGFAFMELLGQRHTVIAPDYPPVQTLEEMMGGLAAILQVERVERCILAGQSYGGLLAQVLLARQPEHVKRLILSSTGPANANPAWAWVDSFCAFLVQILSERPVKRLLSGGLARIVTAPPGEKEEWEAAIAELVEHDLTRADVISHFAVAGDIFRQRAVRPVVYKDWPGRVVVLSAENDPTQSRGDLARFEALFGRSVEVVSMGAMGHTAALFDPGRYVEMLEQAMERPAPPVPPSRLRVWRPRRKKPKSRIDNQI